MNFNKNIIREARMVAVKRKYAEYPERLVQVITPVRNKVLSFVDERKVVSRTELETFLKQLNEETGRNTTMRWVRNNKNLFRKTNENGVIYYRLSKLGQTVLSKTMINDDVNYYYQIKEGKLVTLKRKYTEKFPEKRIALVTPVRQKVLTFVEERKKVSIDELAEFLKMFNEETGRNTTMRWFKNNAYLFKITNENDTVFYSLSKIGEKVLDKTRINESVYIDEVINEDYTDDLIKVLANKNGIDLSQFDMSQLKIGMAVELKHGSKLGNLTDITGDDPEITLRIVLANLMQNPKYYTEAKPENWGKIESYTEPTNTKQKTSDTQEIDGDTEGEDEVTYEPEEFFKDSEEEIEDEKDENEIDNINKTEETEKKEWTNDQKNIIIFFLNSCLDKDMSTDEEYEKINSLAQILDIKVDDLKKCIYNHAYRAAGRLNIYVNADDLDSDYVLQIKNLIAGDINGNISEDYFKKIANKIGIVDIKKIKEVVYKLAVTEYQRKKLTKDSATFEGAAPIINNDKGQGNNHLGDIILAGPEINGTEGKLKSDKPDSLFVGVGQNKGRYSTRRMFSLDDFIHNSLQEDLNTMTEAHEPRIGKKFDKIVSAYKDLLAKKEKMMKDFVVAFKQESDPDKKEKMKKEHLIAYKQLDKEILDMEQKYNAAIQDLGSADFEDDF